MRRMILILMLLFSMSAIADLTKQCEVESGGSAKAVSRLGKLSLGLCQIRPSTFKFVTRRLLHSKRRWNIYSLKDNRYISSVYMRYLENKWAHIQCRKDRYKLALASYNAGLTNIKLAEKRSKGVDYNTIISSLPTVTGRYAKITIAYVEKIG